MPTYTVVLTFDALNQARANDRLMWEVSQELRAGHSEVVEVETPVNVE